MSAGYKPISNCSEIVVAGVAKEEQQICMWLEDQEQNWTQEKGGEKIVEIALLLGISESMRVSELGLHYCACAR